MIFLNSVIVTDRGKYRAICDGFYPMDDRRSIWEKVSYTPLEKVFSLLGIPQEKGDEDVMHNKSYCVYGEDSTHVYAVYLHDFDYYIIKANSEDFSHHITSSPILAENPFARGFRI